jgi:hypothetical protein
MPASSWRAPRSLCRHVCHNTQIQNVVACLETEDPNRDWRLLKALDHEKVNLLTHMYFLHLSRGLENFRPFEEFQEAVWQVESKGLFNKLQALASGNKYALHDIYGPGFQIYLAGSLAYVTQCIPVEARLYDPTNCTQHIPAEICSEEYGNVTQKYVVLSERDHADLHHNELHLQRDPENDWTAEREMIRMVAARRPLGCHVQSPPPPYDGGEEHHGFQQGASRESSPNESYGWAGAWCEQQRDPAAARRNYRIQS